MTPKQKSIRPIKDVKLSPPQPAEVGLQEPIELEFVDDKDQELFGRTKMKLDEKDLANPAVLKVIHFVNKNLRAEIARLKPFVTKFHASDKQVSILSEQVSSLKRANVVGTVIVNIGNLLLGLAFVTSDASFRLIFIACGFALTIVGSLIVIILKEI